MEKPLGYYKNKTENQRQEAKSKTREHHKTPDPGNINRQELIQKPAYLHWNQVPPKSQQASEQDILSLFSNKAGT